MCCNRTLNTSINRLHERCLRMGYRDKNSAFNELLEKDDNLIHYQTLQKLAIKMFIVSRGLSPEIINETFQFREEITYELRQGSRFLTPSVHSVFVVPKALIFFLPKIQALVPNEMKQLESLGKFRKETKTTSCPC